MRSFQQINEGIQLQAIKRAETQQFIDRPKSDPGNVTREVKPTYEVEACLTYSHASDGNWHTVRVRRHEHNLEIQLDDGEHSKSNRTTAIDQETFRAFIKDRNITNGDINEKYQPMPLHVDKQGGVTIGGVPVFDGTKVSEVQQDLIDCEFIFCIPFLFCVLRCNKFNTNI